jgi:hypothetical protein
MKALSIAQWLSAQSIAFLLAYSIAFFGDIKRKIATETREGNRDVRPILAVSNKPNFINKNELYGIRNLKRVNRPIRNR